MKNTLRRILILSAPVCILQAVLIVQISLAHPIPGNVYSMLVFTFSYLAFLFGPMVFLQDVTEIRDDWSNDKSFRESCELFHLQSLRWGKLTGSFNYFLLRRQYLLYLIFVIPYLYPVMFGIVYVIGWIRNKVRALKWRKGRFTV